jgi:hypothetical protein
MTYHTVVRPRLLSGRSAGDPVPTFSGVLYLAAHVGGFVDVCLRRVTYALLQGW